MNKRIQELANKAGAEVKIIHGDMLYISKAELDIEKFAELIVRECAQIGEDVDGNQTTKNEILKHFGVTEQIPLDQKHLFCYN